MQKSWQIARKTGDKGKETRRFDKFVITRRFAFINWEIRDTNQNQETPRLGRSELWSLKYKQKLCGFPEDKSFNRMEILICEFHKKFLKVICKKAKSICKFEP